MSGQSAGSTPWPLTCPAGRHAHTRVPLPRGHLVYWSSWPVLTTTRVLWGRSSVDPLPRARNAGVVGPTGPADDWRPLAAMTSVHYPHPVYWPPTDMTTLDSHKQTHIHIPDSIFFRCWGFPLRRADIFPAFSLKFRSTPAQSGQRGNNKDGDVALAAGKCECGAPGLGVQWVRQRAAPLLLSVPGLSVCVPRAPSTATADRQVLSVSSLRHRSSVVVL